jgi:hypothetical protein
MTNVRGDKFMNFGLKDLKGKNYLEDLNGDGGTTIKRFKKVDSEFFTWLRSETKVGLLSPP